jgi:hypothetical protein
LQIVIFFITVFKEKRNEKGHAKCIRILIEFGADISARDSEGAQPIHYAAYYRMMLCIEALGRATYNAVDGKGYTPFHYGCLPLPQSYIVDYMKERDRIMIKEADNSGKINEILSESSLCPALSTEGKPLHLITLLQKVKCTCYPVQGIESDSVSSCTALLCARDSRVCCFWSIIFPFFLRAHSRYI